MASLSELLLLSILVLSTFISSTLSTKKKYTGHRLVVIDDANVEVRADVAFLVRRELVEVWKMDGDQLELAIQPHNVEQVLQELEAIGIRHEVLSEDVEMRIQESMRNSKILNRESENVFDFSDFYNQTAIDDYIIKLAEMDHALTEVVGHSYEGREIRMLKICKNKVCGTNPAFWIDATIHAREWVTAPAALYAATQLLNSEDTEYIDNIDWYIVPLLNPDGYQFSIDEDRMWRKTRSMNKDSSCVGKDANRNFDFMWGTVGSSTDPCSNTYQGPKPFSEPETRVVRDFFEANPELETKAFLTMHSIGQLVLLPWGYTQNESQDHTQLFELGIKAGDAAELVQDNFYRAGSSACLLYLSSGTIRDWAKGGLGVKYSYTIELTKERVLPPEDIRGAVQEAWAIINEVAKQIVSEANHHQDAVETKVNDN